jgi:hypothetical protein
MQVNGRKRRALNIGRSVGGGVFCALRAETTKREATAVMKESSDANENSRRVVCDGRQPDR